MLETLSMKKRIRDTKQSRTQKGSRKDGLSVWDEEGVKLYPLKVEVTDDVPDDAALEENRMDL